MAKPTPKKPDKLPTWAYIVAAGIGVVLVFLLYRGKKDQPQSPQFSPTGNDTGSGLPQDIGTIGGDGGGGNGGGGGGGGDGGCIPFRKPCTPAGPFAESKCCTGNCSFNTGLCTCHEHDYACKDAHPEHYHRGMKPKPNADTASNPSDYKPSTAHPMVMA